MNGFSSQQSKRNNALCFPLLECVGVHKHPGNAKSTSINYTHKFRPWFVSWPIEPRECWNRPAALSRPSSVIRH